MQTAKEYNNNKNAIKKIKKRIRKNKNILSRSAIILFGNK